MLDEVVDVPGSKLVGQVAVGPHVAVDGRHRARGVHPGFLEVPDLPFGRRYGAEELPEPLDVTVSPGRSDRPIVQILGRHGLEILARDHAATLMAGSVNRATRRTSAWFRSVVPRAFRRATDAAPRLPPGRRPPCERWHRANI